jgi:3-(3-hydroxy-phenyl)propionate hydroxylase
VRFDGRAFDQLLIYDFRRELPGFQDERRSFFDPEWNPLILP